MSKVFPLSLDPLTIDLRCPDHLLIGVKMFKTSCHTHHEQSSYSFITLPLQVSIVRSTTVSSFPPLFRTLERLKVVTFHVAGATGDTHHWSPTIQLLDHCCVQQALPTSSTCHSDSSPSDVASPFPTLPIHYHRLPCRSSGKQLIVHHPSDHYRSVA